MNQDGPSELDGNDLPAIKNPILAYTAGSNIEANSVVVWLVAHGVQAHAVEDLSGVSTFSFGTITQFHQPQVFVDQSNEVAARDLMLQFGKNRDESQVGIDDALVIESECDACGQASEFGAAQDGTVQNCPKCGAFMDVGSSDWPDDFDFGEAEEDVNAVAISAEGAIEAAAMLERQGDWEAAIAAYQDVINRWPDHATYANNCIAAVQQKIDATR